MQIGRLDPRALGLDQRRQALVQHLVAQAMGHGAGGGAAGSVGTPFRGPMGPRIAGGRPLLTQGGRGMSDSILAALGMAGPRALGNEMSGAPGQDVSARAQALTGLGGPPAGMPVGPPVGLGGPPPGVPGNGPPALGNPNLQGPQAGLGSLPQGQPAQQGSTPAGAPGSSGGLVQGGGPFGMNASALGGAVDLGNGYVWDPHMGILPASAPTAGLGSSVRGLGSRSMV